MFAGVERGSGKVVRIHDEVLFCWVMPLVVDEYEEVDGRREV